MSSTAPTAQAVACLVRMAQAELPSKKKSSEKRASLFGLRKRKTTTKKRKAAAPAETGDLCLQRFVRARHCDS